MKIIRTKKFKQTIVITVQTKYHLKYEDVGNIFREEQ